MHICLVIHIFVYMKVNECMLIKTQIIEQQFTFKIQYLLIYLRYYYINLSKHIYDNNNQDRV